MMIRNWTLMLLGASALTTIHTAAMAQESAPAVAEAAPATAEDTATQVEFLQAQVEAMQAQLAELKKATKASAPTWKGAPQFTGEDGWSFKLRGRLQYDAGYVTNPNDAVATKNLGFNSRIRRVRIGAEGSLPGDFGYKYEMDFAGASVGFGDVILTYAPKGKPWSVTIGNHEPFESLEQITSSRFISFIERAQMNDAFGHTRRLGVSVGLADSQNVMRFNAGIFNDVIENSFDNDGWIGAARATYSPQALGGMLHLGANYQHREAQTNNLQNRYRARPFLQTTDIRFVDTSTIATDSDDVFGIELGGIFGPLHVVGEAQWVKVNGYRPGEVANVANTAITTANGAAIFTAEDPDFMSWYAEAGYFLTGETRGYKNGQWDRTKVLNPFNKGGWGAFQVNARYDYLNLGDSALRTGGTGTSSARGGKQTGYLASLIWIPQDYVRFLLQYAHADIEGGPSAAAVEPTSTAAINKRSYGVDTFGVRAQFDF